MRFGADETHCRSCRALCPASDLDRHLWCPSCRKQVKRRGARWGRLVGFVASLGVAAYLILRVHPSPRYLMFYLLMLLLTYILTSRIAVSVTHGYYRARGSVTGCATPEGTE